MPPSFWFVSENCS